MYRVLFIESFVLIMLTLNPLEYIVIQNSSYVCNAQITS